jgi:predicted porin
MIGGKWAAGPFAIGAGFEQLKYESSSAAAPDDFKRKNYVINGTFNVGAGQIFAGYSWTKGAEDCGAAVAATCAGDASKARFISAGYAHNLSKRTKAYFQFGNIKNGPLQSVYYIAGPAGNAAGGTGGLLAGSDVRTFGIGVQHSF